MSNGKDAGDAPQTRQAAPQRTVEELEDEIIILQALVRYWKWRAMAYGAPEFDRGEG